MAKTSKKQQIKGKTGQNSSLKAAQVKIQNKPIKIVKNNNQERVYLEQDKTSQKNVKKAINSSTIIKVISHLVGENIVDLVIELITQDDYSEFKLAEKLNQDVNATRNLLYRLLEHNLVTFTRRKDKRKGWYIYYWTFQPRDIEQKLIQIKEKELNELKNKIEKEFDHDIFFICENKCEKYDFDFASEHNYKCQECGLLLEQHDNTSHKDAVLCEIDSLMEEINLLKSQTTSY
jgi:transcription factor E